MPELKIGPMVGTVVDNNGNQIADVHYGDGVAIKNSKGETIGVELISFGLYKPTHQIDISPKQFRQMLNDDEKADLASSANAIVKKAINAMQFDPEMVIDTTIPDGKFNALMDAAIADGIIDAARKAVLIQGLPT